MRNGLGDLQNHLFAQLERLNDESLDPEQIEMEIKRSEAVSDVAQQILSNANTALKVVKMRQEIGAATSIPPMLEAGDR